MELLIGLQRNRAIVMYLCGRWHVAGNPPFPTLRKC